MSDTTRVLFDAPGPKARMRYRIMAVIGALIILGVLYVVYGRLDEKGQLTAARWDWILTSNAWTNYLWPGIWDTLRAAAISIVLSMVLALALAMARMSDLAPLRWLAGIVVEFFRAVPVLIMMLFAFWFLVHRGWFPDSINPLIGVVFGLTMYNSAVLCEVIRNGVASLPAGQREAGLSIGLSPSQVRRSILIPQSLTAMLPTLVSQIIVITKDTALGYLILYPELVTRARQLGSAESATLPAYVVAAVLFILLNYGLSKVAEAVENRQRRRARSAGKVGDADAPPPVAPIPVGLGGGGG
ncbi:amino acid ABC transporter permease [Ornithinimicrobium sp. F0845]|uniref:amino acid ABC transporter permease n=1 Tax=Ornithinimicrobium sp. F0845 TaxID=2926412 RepID=UPI001FF683DD|nr:amino acid ABC transporter permease [Ornithinimicrobium sp. F0845]MCK0114130.1 amino acid ABC transporter permease [Ornithinimicrobium sp. F0845]